MNKKIMTFLLAIFYVVSTLNVFADSNDTDASDTTDINGLLSVINAVNPDYTLPEDAEYFSRIEFVKLLIDVMCPQKNEKRETGFGDVEADSPYSASLGFAKDFGIISEAPLFYPDDAVTYTQAIKMAVTAAGYKPLADAKGAYPVGYLTIASELELANGLYSSGDSPLLVADGLRLITNLFDTLVFVQTGFGEEFVYDTIDGKTFLNYYHNIETVYDIVYANEYSFLTDAQSALAQNKIRIGVKECKMSGDFSDLLGYSVKAYIKNSNEVIYAEKYDVNEVILDTSSVDRVDGFDVITYDGIKEKKYRLDDSFNYIRNGKASVITASDFTPYFKFDTGYVSLIDNNGDNKYDTIKALVYKYTLISKVSLYDNMIFDENSSDNSIVLGDDCTYSLISYESGEKENITLKQISQGMLIAYTASDDKKLYDITVCSDVIEGKITGTDSTNKIVYINDIPYKTSDYYETYYSNISVGTDGSYIVGIDGKLVAISATGEDYMKYGWFVGFSNPSGLEEPKLKIFSQSNEMQILTLGDKVLIDNQPKDASYTKTFMEGLDDTSRLIRFSSNADGVLKRIDTYTAADDKEFELSDKAYNDSLTKFATGSYTFKSGINIFTISSPNTFSFHIETSTYNFIIPPAGSSRNDDSKYAVVQPSYYANDTSYTSVSAFDVDDFGCAGATMYFADTRLGRTLGHEEGTAVIEKITTGLNPDGENSLVVYAWKGNKYGIYYSDPELTEDYIRSLNPGDLVRFVTDERGVITAITRDFNILNYEITQGRATPGDINEYVMGISYGASDKYINLLTNPMIVNNIPLMPQSYGINNIRNVNISNASMVYVDVVRNKDGTIASATPRMSEKTDVRSYLDSGDSANFVISRQRYSSPLITVVYNIEVK